jgi:hypothetical protein
LSFILVGNFYAFHEKKNTMIADECSRGESNPCSSHYIIISRPMKGEVITGSTKAFNISLLPSACVEIPSALTKKKSYPLMSSGGVEPTALLTRLWFHLDMKGEAITGLRGLEIPSLSFVLYENSFSFKEEKP